MAKYDVSVVIPVYNVAKNLEKCINSIRNQRKENIEIICVDDCSTDESLQILQKASLEDSRVRIIGNNENKGLLYARKCGVMAAEGEYVMFLDGDDFYSDDACETAHAAIVKYGTDILQFGMNVINAGNVPRFEVDSFEQFVIPYDSGIICGKVLDACFKEEKYNYNVVNKIYKTSLCKSAFSKLDDQHYCMAEDMLAYFVLAYFADSYMGISDKLYNYNFGIGISRPGGLDLDGLDKRCCGADSVAAVKRFLEEQGTFNEYKEVYTRMERRILSDNFDAWYYRLLPEQREKGYAIFERHWGKDKVILGLLYDIENKQFDINQKRDRIDELKRICEELSEELSGRDKLIIQSETEIDSLKAHEEELLTRVSIISEERTHIQRENEHIVQSLSYKTGRFVTWIPRMVLRLIKDCIFLSGMIKCEKNSQKGVEEKVEMWDNGLRAEQSRAEQSRAEQSRVRCILLFYGIINNKNRSYA